MSDLLSFRSLKVIGSNAVAGEAKLEPIEIACNSLGLEIVISIFFCLPDETLGLPKDPDGFLDQRTDGLKVYMQKLAEQVQTMAQDPILEQLPSLGQERDTRTDRSAGFIY